VGTKLGTTGKHKAKQKDMAYPPGMELHGSKWRVKKRVPTDLLEKHPYLYKTAVLTHNTGETDKKLAAVKAWKWLAEREEEFQRVRETGTPYKSRISAEEMDFIVRRAIRSTVQADEELRTLGQIEEAREIFANNGCWGDGNESLIREAVTVGKITSDTIELAQEWLYGHGFDFPDDAPEVREFAFRLMRGFSQADKIKRARDAGEWIDTPPEPVLPTKKAAPKLSHVIEYFISKQDADVPMFKKYRPALSLFVEYVGDKTVDELKQKDIDDYFELLCKLPPRWYDQKKKLGKNVRELAAMDWDECISRKTFDDGYMAAFRPFLIDSIRVFQDQGFPGHLTTQRIKYSGDRDESENQQRAMRPDELVRLFTGAEYRGFATNPLMKHCYWLPLIGLYTGARVNEVCQLNPQCDIREEQGVWIFDITEKSEADATVRKSIKNRSSRRRVPIHSELLRLGFLKYVEEIKQRGEKRLFPEWPASAEGRAAGKAERWFRGLIKSTGLRDETPGARLVGFHAFRHTFLAYAMNNDVLFAEWVTGHASESVSRVVAKYQGEAEISRKAKIVEAIRFDIQHIEPQWPDVEA